MRVSLSALAVCAAVLIAGCDTTGPNAPTAASAVPGSVAGPLDARTAYDRPARSIPLPASFGDASRRSGLATTHATPSAVTAAVGPNLVVNGSFEASDDTLTGWTVVDQTGGSGSWAVQMGTSSPTGIFTVEAPTDGSNAAMTFQGGPGSHLLYQDIAVPASGGMLSFDISLYSNAPYAVQNALDYTVIPNQHARVDLLDPTNPDVFDVGDEVENVWIVDADETPLPLPYTRIEYDLANWAGQTVRLRFGQVDNQNFFSAGIDNVVVMANEAADACSRGDLLRIADFDADGEPAGERVALLNTDTRALDLSTCSFVTFNPFTERVTYAANLSTVLAPGETFLLGDPSVPETDLTFPAGTIPDGPGAIAVLAQSDVALGTVVTEVAGQVVASVVYVNETMIVGQFPAPADTPTASAAGRTSAAGPVARAGAEDDLAAMLAKVRTVAAR